MDQSPSHGVITFKNKSQSIALDKSPTQFDINRQRSFVIETDGEHYSGVSNLHSKKKSVNQTSEFMERFQGRQSLMNKEGHIGVVKNAKQPIVKKIDKVEINQNLI